MDKEIGVTCISIGIQYMKTIVFYFGCLIYAQQKKSKRLPHRPIGISPGTSNLGFKN